MLNSQTHPAPVVILGAGPYGLSLAAHLRAKGVPFRIFGEPMQTWATQMPASLRLNCRNSVLDLSTATASFPLGQFRESSGPGGDPDSIRVEDFVAYGQEFARRFVPNLEVESILSIRPAGMLFRLITGSGEVLFARRVMVTTGLNLCPKVPVEFRHLPSARISHPAQHHTYQEFAGREVTVAGEGPGSTHAAAALRDAGARVTLISPARRFYAGQPAVFQLSLLTRVTSFLQPAASRKGASAQSAREEQPELGFSTLFGCRIHAVEKADGSGEKLRVTVSDRSGTVRQHLTSHLIAGSEYEVDLSRLRFLSAEIRALLRVHSSGEPKLNRNFESSVKGLHLIGPASAASCGPMLRYVSGARLAAERLSLHLQREWLRERGGVSGEAAHGTSAERPRFGAPSGHLRTASDRAEALAAARILSPAPAVEVTAH